MLERCSVCSEEIEKEKMNTTYLPCKHSFHTICIYPWIVEHNTCPNCRMEVYKKIEEQQSDDDLEPDNLRGCIIILILFGIIFFPPLCLLKFEKIFKTSREFLEQLGQLGCIMYIIVGPPVFYIYLISTVYYRL